MPVKNRFAQLATVAKIQQAGEKLEIGDYTVEVVPGDPGKFIQTRGGKELFVLRVKVLQADSNANNTQELQPTKVGVEREITQTRSKEGDPYMVTMLLKLMGVEGTPDEDEGKAAIPAILYAIETGETVEHDGQKIGPDFLSGCKLRVGVFPGTKPDKNGKLWNKEMYSAD